MKSLKKNFLANPIVLHSGSAVDMSENFDNHTSSFSDCLAACVLVFTEQNGWKVRENTQYLVKVMHIQSPRVYTAIEMASSINNAMLPGISIIYSF